MEMVKDPNADDEVERLSEGHLQCRATNDLDLGKRLRQIGCLVHRGTEIKAYHFSSAPVGQHAQPPPATTTHFQNSSVLNIRRRQPRELTEEFWRTHVAVKIRIARPLCTERPYRRFLVTTPKLSMHIGDTANDWVPLSRSRPQETGDNLSRWRSVRNRLDLEP